MCVCALDPEFEPRSVGTNVLLLNTFSVVFPQKSILRPVSCWHHQNRPGSVIKISPGSSLRDAASMGYGRPGNLYFSQLFQVTRWSARCEMDVNRGPLASLSLHDDYFLASLWVLRRAVDGDVSGSLTVSLPLPS